MVEDAKVKRVVVIGAGISGLSFAWFLKQRLKEEVDVKVFEAADQTGGWIRTLNYEGFLFERGPRSLRTAGAGACTLGLVKQLGIESQVVAADPQARNRYLWTDSTLTKLPTGLWSFLASKKTRDLIGPLLKEWRVPAAQTADESVDAFFRRRLGSEAAEVFVDSMVSGIFAGDPRELSVKACFPAIYRMEEEQGSLLKAMVFGGKSSSPADDFVKQMQRSPIFSFKRGLQTLTDALTHRLGGDVRTVTQVQSILKTDKGFQIVSDGQQIEADHVVSALPASTLAGLLIESSPELSSALKKIKCCPLAVVHLGFRHQVLKQQGFGYLVPFREREKILGVVFDSSVFPSQNSHPEETRLSVMIGGQRYGELVQKTERELLELAREAIYRHLGIQATPDVALVHRFASTVPQYTLGHLDRVKQLEELAAQWSPSFTLLGNSYYGVGVNDCVAKAEELANSIDFARNSCVSTADIV